MHPAGLGGLHHLGLDAEFPVRHRHASAGPAGAGPGAGVQNPHLVHAGGGLGDDLVDRRLLDPFVPGRAAGDPGRDLRGRGAGQFRPLDDVPQDHLAAALAGDGAGLHHPDDPAAEDLRSGLPVLGGRAADREHGAGLLRLAAGLREQPGRPRGRGGGDAVRAGDRGGGAAVPAAASGRGAAAMTAATARRWSLAGGLLTLLTVICAVLWAFPLYWGAISSLKPEDEVVRPYIELWPDTFTFRNYVFALTQTQIGIWYLNSVIVAVWATV